MKTQIILLLFLIFSHYENVFGRSNRVRRIVGGEPADVAPYDEPVTYVRSAEKSATIRGVLDIPHYSFRGIRFARSPTGVDRFQRPRKYVLEGEYNATEYPPPCPQPVPDTDYVIGKEDCLFLNVYTPNLPEGEEGLPVIVWIHGGGFRYGSASQYGAKHLMKKKVVLVTIQYRLGTLGFLGSGSPEFPGNAGVFDMALALEWTKNYIGFFGGNANKITVMGQGTGGSSAVLLALSKIAKAIPCSVIAMSGTALSNWAIDKTPSNTAKEVAEYQDCPTDNVVSMVKCLQEVDAQAIIKGDNYIESNRLKNRGFLSGLSGLLSSSPVTEGVNDGRSLPGAIQRQPLDDMSSGRKPNIPLLTGVTRDETKKAINDQYKEEVVSDLKSIPNFLDNVLIKNLQSLTGLETDGKNDGNSNAFWNVLDPLQFRSYVFSTSKSLVEGLNKISEVTGDALFNLPAFLTADLWSKNNTPAYLYRFEHYGKLRKGSAFLKGLPIISDKDVGNETISHGDDLSYIFEAKNLDGSPLKGSETLTAEDEKVRDLFSQIISDFARDGKIHVNDQLIPGFTSATNNFIQINAKPRISDQFRFCEMALWAGLADRLKSSACKLLDVTNVPILNGNIINTIGTNGLSNVTNTISKPFRVFEEPKSPLNWLG